MRLLHRIFPAEGQSGDYKDEFREEIRQVVAVGKHFASEFNETLATINLLSPQITKLEKRGQVEKANEYRETIKRTLANFLKTIEKFEAEIKVIIEHFVQFCSEDGFLPKEPDQKLFTGKRKALFALKTIEDWHILAGEEEKREGKRVRRRVLDLIKEDIEQVSRVGENVQKHMPNALGNIRDEDAFEKSLYELFHDLTLLYFSFRHLLEEQEAVQEVQAEPQQPNWQQGRESVRIKITSCHKEKIEFNLTDQETVVIGRNNFSNKITPMDLFSRKHLVFTMWANGGIQVSCSGSNKSYIESPLDLHKTDLETMMPIIPKESFKEIFDCNLERGEGYGLHVLSSDEQQHYILWIKVLD